MPIKDLRDSSSPAAPRNARLRERGDREAVGEGFGIYTTKTTPHRRLRRTLGEGRCRRRPCCASKCRNSRPTAFAVGHTLPELPGLA